MRHCAIVEASAGKLAPENTLAAFKLGASHGYRMFECDAKLSADGSTVLYATYLGGARQERANGIAVADDERFIFVATIGGREVVKFDRSTTPIGKQVMNIDIAPDNIRWASPTKLLTAGNNYVSPDTCSGPTCATGWSVLEIDAETLVATRVGGADQSVALQGVSSALQVGNDLWIGSFNDDRVGKMAKQ